jgi:hypothetical protein
MRSRPHPLRRAALGALAGVAGTLAMDLVWYRRARRDGSDAAFPDWEVVRDLDRWEDAPAPGRMGRKIVATVSGDDPPAERAAAISNVMHWAYGTTWGALYALAFPRRRWWTGPALGGFVWSSDYVTLPLAGVYEPIWKYDLPTLRKDLSAHLVFGAATDAAARALGV